MGWEGGERDVQVGGDMGKNYMIYIDKSLQIPTQHCKTNILQLAINKF